MTHRPYFINGTSFRAVDKIDIEAYHALHSCSMEVAKIGCHIERLDEIKRNLRIQIDVVANDQIRKCLMLISLILEVL